MRWRYPWAEVYFPWEGVGLGWPQHWAALASGTWAAGTVSQVSPLDLSIAKKKKKKKQQKTKKKVEPHSALGLDRKVEKSKVVAKAFYL